MDTSLISILSALGLSTIVTTLLNYFLNRRVEKSKVSEETSKAKLEFSTTLQAELWKQIEGLRGRLDEQGTRLGVAIEDRARAVAEFDAIQAQLATEKETRHEIVTELTNRYATAAQQKSDCDFYREKEKAKFEKRIDDLETAINTKEKENSVLSRRVLDLEHDLARIIRGGPTRKNDEESVQ